jgi:hypothetical protein
MSVQRKAKPEKATEEPVSVPVPVEDESVVGKAPEKKCNVGECRGEVTTRGLCDAHWASRRGDADPKEKRSGD